MTKVTHLTLDERGSLSRKRIHLREISGEADAPLETVGQDLRAARLRRGDDLATVSRTLKIRKEHLEALEEDRLEALPGRAYAVGFVRSYADFLGLDPLQCVERFKAEIAGRSEAPPTFAPTPEPEPVRLPQGWLFIGLVVIALIFYVAYNLARSADTLLKQQVASSTTQSAAPPAASTHHQAAAMRPPWAGAPGTAPGTSTPAPAAVPAGGNPSQPVTAQTPASPPGQPTVTPTTAGSEPGSTAAQAAAPGAALAALPPGHAYGQENHNARVVLRVILLTHILVQGADGTVFINRILQPGDSYNVPNKVGLTLTTPNGGAVGLELDGQPMGSAAKGSQMTEALSLDPQAIVDRYNHANPG